MADPHQAVHEQAEGEHEDHPPVLDGAEPEQTLEEKLVHLDERLTKRINDLRKDSDANRKAVSASVGAFQNDIADLRTSTENNAAAVESLKGALDLATKDAKAAKKAADDVTARLAALHDQFTKDLALAQKQLAELHADYEHHTHDVEITLHGATQGPKKGGSE